MDQRFIINLVCRALYGRALIDTVADADSSIKIKVEPSKPRYNSPETVITTAAACFPFENFLLLVVQIVARLVGKILRRPTAIQPLWTGPGSV